MIHATMTPNEKQKTMEINVIIVNQRFKDWSSKVEKKVTGLRDTVSVIEM